MYSSVCSRVPHPDTQQKPSRVGVFDALKGFGDGRAGADQMLTIPVASCNEVVCARAGSTQARSASGDPPIQAAP